MKQIILLISLSLYITLAFGQYAKFEKFQNLKENCSQMDLKETLLRQEYSNLVFKQTSRIKSQRNVLKLENSAEQRLDSIINYKWNDDTNQWEGVGKDEYIYDDSINRTQYISYELIDDNSQWVGFRREEYTYDNNGNMTLYSDYRWDKQNNQWAGKEKEEYSYDDNNNNKTQYINYDWDDENNLWYYYNKYDYSYDDNNNKTQYILYNWDDGGNQWNTYYKCEYTYNIDTALSQCIIYKCNAENNEWNLYNKFEYIYNNEYNRQRNSYNWNTDSEQWDIYRQYEYTYDSIGDVTLYALNEWDTDNNEWDVYYKYKYEHTYNTNSDEVQYVMYQWSTYSSQWKLNLKIDYSYDGNGNPISETLVHYDSGDTCKYEYTYDYSYVLSDIKSPAFSWFFVNKSENIINKPLEYYIGCANQKGIYYYSTKQNSSNSKEISTENIVVYPNPASNYLKVSFPITVHMLLLNCTIYKDKEFFLKVFQIMNRLQLTILLVVYICIFLILVTM